MLLLLVLIKSIQIYCALGRNISVFCTLFSLFPHLLSQDFSRFLYSRGKAFLKTMGPYLNGQLQAQLNPYSDVMKVTIKISTGCLELTVNV